MHRHACFLLLAGGVAITGCSAATPPQQACTPPRAHWTKPHNSLALLPPRFELSLARDGTIYWDGKQISDKTLGEYLGQARAMNPRPQIFLETEMGVSCARLEAIRDRMETALACRNGGSDCAEGVQSIWRELPHPPGTPVS